MSGSDIIADIIWNENQKRKNGRSVPKTYDVDTLGRAIHEAHKVGGPWGPPCVREVISVGLFGFWTLVQCDYDYNSGMYECLCKSMASHLIEIMEKENAGNLSAL